MTSFFVGFMETYYFDRICNTHRLISDQRPKGVADLYYIMLAEMASTAVNSSKTGIPVSFSPTVICAILTTNEVDMK